VENTQHYPKYDSADYRTCWLPSSGNDIWYL